MQKGALLLAYPQNDVKFINISKCTFGLNEIMRTELTSKTISMHMQVFWDTAILQYISYVVSFLATETAKFPVLSHTKLVSLEVMRKAIFSTINFQ